jgi:hypothetical protein
MSDDTKDRAARTVTMPLAADLLDRAEALRGYVRTRTDYAPTGHATRAAVLRLALARGLDALEREAQKRPGR